MKKFKIILVFIALSIIFISCATTPMTSSENDAEGKSFQTPDGMANIYFVRDSNLFGSAFAFPISVSQHTIGQLNSGRYFLVHVLPGTYLIEALSTENFEHDKLVVSAGKSYFYQIGASMGLVQARVWIMRVDQSTGEKLVRSANRSVDFFEENNNRNN